MTKNNSYAQERIGFYEAQLQNETINQLVEHCNTLASSRGWVAERSYFSQALTMELLRRGVDLSVVCKDNAIRYIPIGYDSATHSLVAITKTKL